IMRGERMAPISKPDSGENFQTWTPGRSPIQYAELEPDRQEDEVGSTGVGGEKDSSSQEDGATGGGTATLVDIRVSTDLNIVGKAERKVDAVKLVTGKPAFVDDIELRGLLH